MSFANRPSARLITAWLSAVLVTGLLSRDAHAHLSPTTATAYDLTQLSSHDWRSLEHAFVPQSLRGSMALIFPNRPPITDQREIETYVKNNAILGFSFPGLNAGPLASWALAKQFAMANHKPGQTELPVVAVNSGWTDWLAMFGHFYELATVRSAVNAGRADRTDFIATKVANLIKERNARLRKAGKPATPILLGSHSAGGYIAANVAWLLHEQGQRADLGAVRVQSIGLAVNVPRGTKVARQLGDEDVIGAVNSSSAALVEPSTTVTPGVSHVNGALWRLGDSVANEPWRVSPMDQLFSQGPGAERSARGKAIQKRIAFYRKRSARTQGIATKARRVAEANAARTGTKALIYANMSYHATQLSLNARRDAAVADYLEARRKGDEAGLPRIKEALSTIKTQRDTARRQLATALESTHRDVLSDSLDFLGYMGKETVTSMHPLRVMTKTIQGTQLMFGMTANAMNLMANNPWTNPFRFWFPAGASTPRRQAARPVTAHSKARRH